ncbi:MAG: STAS domain-containing protein [Planctomycetota bacterium]
MDVSSGASGAVPIRCPACGKRAEVNPSDPAWDGQCPRCGRPLWFANQETGETLAARLEPGGKPIDVGVVIEISAAAVERVREEVSRMSVAPHLMLDFSGVRVLGSNVIGELVALQNVVAARSGRLKLCSVRREILEVLKISRLDGLFEIEKA